MRPEDRPADAGAVAALIAGCRAAAEGQVREGEARRIAAAAVAAERRMRRRVQLALAVVLILAAGIALTLR